MSNLKGLLVPPKGAEDIWFQERGRIFERILRQILEDADMDPRGSMRPGGEEIDGSFGSSGRYFLFEAKWRKKPIPASDLYAFKGKVDGKLIGTIGIVFSMSGFSTDAVDALIAGKELNLILFGPKDLILIDDKKISIADALNAKLRYASERGQPFFSLESWLAENHDHMQSPSMRKWEIVVEDEIEADAFDILLDRFEVQVKPTIHTAGSRLAIPSLVGHLKQAGFKDVAALVSANTPVEQLDDLRKELNDDSRSLIVLPYAAINWIESACDVDYLNALEMVTQRPAKMARRYARNADLAKLLDSSPEFANFINALKRKQKK